jgi:hypothetical protein
VSSCRASSPGFFSPLRDFLFHRPDHFLHWNLGLLPACIAPRPEERHISIRGPNSLRPLPRCFAHHSQHAYMTCPRADTLTVVFELSQHSVRVGDCDESVVWQSCRSSPQRQRGGAFAWGDQSTVHLSSDGVCSSCTIASFADGWPDPSCGLCQHCILGFSSIDPATVVEQSILIRVPGVREVGFEIGIVSLARNGNVPPRYTDRGHAPLFNLHDSMSSSTKTPGVFATSLSC